MKEESMDELHEDAKAEDFERDVAAEVKVLAKDNAGSSARFSRVLANTAFWMRVYHDVTGGDPMAMLLVADLAQTLEVSMVDARYLN